MSTTENCTGTVCVSIVSHGHCDMLRSLMSQLSKLHFFVGHVILTHNIRSVLKLDVASYPFQVTIIENSFPLGFGANHNQAFIACNKPYFCVLNPDVEFDDDPFKELIKCLEDTSIGVVAPLVVNKKNVIEDSFRHFPTPISLVRKLFSGSRGSYGFQSSDAIIFPDWCAGMCLLFKREIYSSLNGFDESYFLYYEDIDICLRIWRSGNAVALSKASTITHEAQRDSHFSFIFFRMHITSILIFFYKHLFRFPR